MKILVIGGAGFIGFNIAKYYSSKGHKVHIIDDLSRGKIDKDFSDLIVSENVTLINETLSNIYNIINDDFDFIFHLAAIVGVKNVLDKPYETLNTNIYLTDLAIKIAKRQKKLIRFIFTSTSEIYSSAVDMQYVNVPTKEETPFIMSNIFEARSTYKLSKIVGEVMCINAGISYTIFRPHNIYGPRMGMDHVIPELIKKMTSNTMGKSIEIKSYEHTRAFCYIDDAIEIIATIVNSPATKNKIFNLGCEEEEISIGELAKLISKTLKKNILIKPGKIEQGSTTRRSPDMKYTFSKINTHQYTFLEDGLKKTYDWYRNFICEEHN